MIAIPTVLFMALVFGAIAFFRLQSIRLTEDAVVMHTAYKDTVYPIAELEFVSMLPREEWRKGLFRTFGYGFPFPLYGHFRNGALGSVMIYSVSQADNLALFRFHDKKLLIELSPPQLEQIRMTTRKQRTSTPTATLPEGLTQADSHAGLV